MSLTVTRSNGTTDITFALSSNSGTKKEFINPNAGLLEPEIIVLQSFPRPIGANGSDRYVFKASKTFREDATGNNVTASAKLELVYPRSAESGLLTSFLDQVAFLKSLTGVVALTALTAGVVPEGDFHVDVFNPA